MIQIINDKREAGGLTAHLKRSMPALLPGERQHRRIRKLRSPEALAVRPCAADQKGCDEDEG